MSKHPINDSDLEMIVKIALYQILGLVWMVNSGGYRIFPIGLVIGYFLTKHEKLRLNQRLEFAPLVMGSTLGLVGVGGVYLALPWF
ncbi:hypothetical protein KA531_00540 [Candidatus Saccharibacteria bacterium]|nr:hypothetical protein [Candidatus Saccharibacteria bacterium]